MIPQEYFDKVRKYFNGDTDKTWVWFKTMNSRFGMFTPLDMLKLGRGEKVKKVIDETLKGKTL
ncbi:hypothetical protein KW791_00220 [Candidatus Parcubacteria bacterium]|nr:hypothetical protein [Candidatus Parcubacteria bacterium]